MKRLLRRAGTGRLNPMAPNSKRQAIPCRRSGATAIETAITLSLLLMLVLGMLELGIAVYRQHIVSYAARQATRRAIVHGELAIPSVGKWGPATYQGTADFGDGEEDDDPHPIAAAVRPHLTGLNKSQTTIRMEWLDGNNEINSRVRTTISTPHQPFLTFVFGSGSWTVSGSSTMLIAH